jgi:hypothetical protein
MLPTAPLAAAMLPTAPLAAAPLAAAMLPTAMLPTARLAAASLPSACVSMPRYVVVPEGEVAPPVVAMVREIVERALPALDLGATPEIRWFADVRELPGRRVAAAREVFTPGDGFAKAGSVPPFVRYSAEKGWEPARPVIMLNRSKCLRDTPLHELRHLWQIKAGMYRADEESTQELEDEADAWAADALARLDT